MYGDADLIPHLLYVLSSGAIDVTVSWGEAVAYGDRDSRAVAGAAGTDLMVWLHLAASKPAGHNAIALLPSRAISSQD
jgi:hypothetical protein